ncbi:MAG: AAA family ATPase [Ideonella sp.]|nr:AAA family ATPase [Ideonella sp.]
MAHFTQLALHHWRQFELVDIDLRAQTTILTGANGCGKTSILTVLSHHFGWNLNFVSTPYISRKTKRRLYSEFARSRGRSPGNSIATIPEDVDDGAPPDQTPEAVGSITYSTGAVCTLNSPSKLSKNAQYRLQYTNAIGIDGLYIPSHRPAASYQPVSSIPTDPRTNAQHYQEYQQVLLQMFSGSKTSNPGNITKQSLISLALFGYGNAAVAENPELRELFESFQDILRTLLPDRLGFRRLEIRMPDVVLATDSGDFALDAMSGGVNALFTIAWQIQMFGWKKSDCTVLIDEPENHLHPSMQRSLMPSLAKAFPAYRFVVATHSPFIVTSDPHANVFALTHDADRRVVSSHLAASDLAASPDKVLRDILDVPTTIPIWAEEKLRAALLEYSNRGSDPAAMDDLFATLRQFGLHAAAADLPSPGSKA